MKLIACLVLQVLEVFFSELCGRRFGLGFRVEGLRVKGFRV